MDPISIFQEKEGSHHGKFSVRLPSHPLLLEHRMCVTCLHGKEGNTHVNLILAPVDFILLHMACKSSLVKQRATGPVQYLPAHQSTNDSNVLHLPKPLYAHAAVGREVTEQTQRDSVDGGGGESPGTSVLPSLLQSDSDQVCEWKQKQIIKKLQIYHFSQCPGTLRWGIIIIAKLIQAFWGEDTADLRSCLNKQLSTVRAAQGERVCAEELQGKPRTGLVSACLRHWWQPAWKGGGQFSRVTSPWSSSRHRPEAVERERAAGRGYKLQRHRQLLSGPSLQREQLPLSSCTKVGGGGWVGYVSFFKPPCTWHNHSEFSRI